jgi:16S rRNA (uracil1498-N3)-methyltransferase
MPHRFYCPLLVETGFVTLSDGEAHHLIHVLRLQPDDIVDIFNGQGLCATCRVTVIRKRDAQLEVLSFQREDPPSPVVTLATAVPKGDRFDWLIEKTTELGVTRLIPLLTARSIVDPRTSKLDKLRQTVVAACKQSGRNHLMEITSVTPWSIFVSQIVPEQRVFVAHPTGQELRAIDCQDASGTRETVMAIGPEGGFSDDEIQSALRSGAQAICLGRRILRIETAAIALASKFLL